MRTSLASAAAAAALLAFGLAGTAHADTYQVRYDVTMYNSGGFAASYWHTATSGHMTRTVGSDTYNFYAGGTITHELSGSIFATVDTDAGTITFTSGTITGSDRSGSQTLLGYSDVDDLELDVTGGSIGVDPGNGRPDGTLEGTFDDGNGNTEDQAFWFAPFYFAAKANGFETNDPQDIDDYLGLYLWANNWALDANGNPSGLSPPSPASERMGIDLVLVGTIVPEPSSVALLGIGLAAAACLRRRRLTIQNAK